MNHSRITLAITAIIAAAALTTVGFAVPQQVMAGGHHNHNNNNNNGIKVNQSISQANLCDVNTLCLNNGNNTADIHR